jgi:hypothetical protein
MSSTCNKQDASASISTQLQVRGSIRALGKGASPLSTPTAPLQDHQNAIALQFKSGQRCSKPINCLPISIAIMLIVVGAIVWVLSSTDTIKGPWSGVCTALFTSVGTIITLIQLYLQFTALPAPVAVTTLLPPEDTQSSDPLDGDFSIPRPGGQEGVLVVYTKRSLRGLSIALCCGFWEDADPCAAQNIVERKMGGHTYYMAVFESLPPGSYTAHIYKREMTAKVTVYSGRVTAIDWR